MPSPGRLTRGAARPETKAAGTPDRLLSKAGAIAANATDTVSSLKIVENRLSRCSERWRERSMRHHRLKSPGGAGPWPKQVPGGMVLHRRFGRLGEPFGPEFPPKAGWGQGRRTPRKSTPSTSSIVKNHWFPSENSSYSRTRPGMGQVGQRSEFVLESIERRAIHPQDGLEGDQLVALAVERLVHHPHSTRAQLPTDQKPLRARECVLCRFFQRT